MSTIKLQGNDGKEPIDVDIEVACCSQLIKTMLKDLGHNMEEEDQNDVIPLPNVSDAILRKVIEWAKHHKDDKNIEDITNRISVWDAEYLKVDQETLFDLILAANYLDVGGLLHLTCKHVGVKLRGMSADEIRNMYNLTNDFTAAEEKQVREENKWIVD